MSNRRGPAIHEAAEVAVVIGDMNLFRAVVAPWLAPYVISRKANRLWRLGRKWLGIR